MLMRLILGLLSLSLIGACATSAKISDNGQSIIEVPAGFTIKQPVPQALKGYIPDFERSLNSLGFVQVESGTAEALLLELDFNPNPFATKVMTRLTMDGETIASSESLNAGWGTGVARGVAIKNLVDKSAGALYASLNGLGDRLVVLPTTGKLVGNGTSRQSVGNELKILNELREEGVITDEEFEAQKEKLLNG